MSSALNSPQSFNPNNKLPKLRFRIRWRLAIAGFCLFAIGLALPFALNLYYSSSYSQISDSKLISGKLPEKTPKLSFKKQSVQPNNSAAFSFAASESDNPETFQASVISKSKLPAAQQARVDVTGVRLSRKIVGMSCPNGQRPSPGISCGKDATVSISTFVSRQDADMTYIYTVSGGRVIGSGANIVWNLGNAGPGTYTITAGVENKRGMGKTITERVQVEKCDCIPIPTPSPSPTTTTPTRTPVPSPTQTTSPIPTETPTPTPTATSANNIDSNTPTPKPTTPPLADTNVAVNTNSTSSNNDADKFGYTYPSRFIKDKEYMVCLSLQPEYSTLNLCENKDSNTPVVSGEAVTPPISRPGYDAYITAKLITTNDLEIIAQPEQIRLPYDRQSGIFPTWKWKLKLSSSGERSETVAIQFNCDVEWVSKKNRAITEKQEKLWRSEPLKSGVGLPFATKILAFLLSLGGGLALVVSAIPAWGGTKEDVLENEVTCTAYSPKRVKAGNDFIVQIFAHLAEQIEMVRETAGKFNAEAEPVPEQITRRIRQGSTISFRLVIESLGIDKQSDTHQWNGEIIRERFVVSVPENQNPSQRWGKIYLVENSVPVGNLMFQFEIVADAVKASEPSPTVGNLKRFETPFISYSSKDRWKVLMRVQMLDAENKKYFMDVLSLKRGDRWAEKIDEYIDKCDVFYLFWSKNAKNSDYVKKEILRAYRRQGGKAEVPPDIIPIPIEKPPPVEPPEELKFLHFNDEFSYLIFAAEKENLFQRFRYWFLSLFFWKND